MNRNLFHMLFVVSFLFATTVFAQIDFPSFISSNMVLQQQTEASIWGWADKGTDVKIECSWDNSEYTTVANEDGKWQTKVKTPKAGGPYTITINEQTLENILIGEVWICSGQSNMQWPLNNTDGGSEEIELASYPQIRLYYAARQLGDIPQDDCYGYWVECNPKTASTFSAVAYYFGKKLHQDLNVPIGLIHTSWGGSSGEAWVKKEILKADHDYQIYFDRQKKNEQNAEPGILALNQHSPSRLYNAMIHPFIPFAIKGAIWYQGETNTSEPILYEKLFPTMIKNWRNDWQLGDFPFYFVQLAPYNYKIPIVGALVRDSQRKSLSVLNTGMVVTLDIGNPDDIHPRNKLDVGERLARWTLVKDYGKEGVIYSGPLYKSMKVENHKARVYFDHVGSGLMADSGDLTHFEIAGEDKILYPAKAVIDGETVLVESDKVNYPVAVRYAFGNTDEPNLFNEAGLPASSFRTDNWNILFEPVKISGLFDVEKNEFVINLYCEKKSLDIRYTIDGSDPTSDSPLYNQSLNFKESVQIKARAFLGKNPSITISENNFRRSLTQGKKITIKSNYSSKYNAGGDLALINSIKGSRDLMDGNWQGYEKNDLDVIIDLGKIENINKISSGFLQTVEAWVFFPRKVEYAISEDGNDFVNIGVIENDIPENQSGELLKEFVLEKEIKTRYIRVFAENVGVCPDWHPGAGGEAWIFADEIIVE